MEALGHVVKAWLKPGHFMVVCMLLFAACDNKPDGEKGHQKREKGSVEVDRQEPLQEPLVVPEFNGDSAFAFVARQVIFGPRVPNTDAHDACAQWLSDELERHGAQVTIQQGQVRAFDGTILNIKNIIGAYQPELRSACCFSRTGTLGPLPTKTLFECVSLLMVPMTARPEWAFY